MVGQNMIRESTLDNTNKKLSQRFDNWKLKHDEL